MRMEDVNARKAYIQKARSSFDSPKRRYEFEQDSVSKREAADGFPFWKVRLLAAALLFAAYIFCDRTDTEINHISMKDVSEEIVHNFSYEDAKEGARQAWKWIQAD